jgi:hypothetical protein
MLAATEQNVKLRLRKDRDMVDTPSKSLGKPAEFENGNFIAAHSPPEVSTKEPLAWLRIAMH